MSQARGELVKQRRPRSVVNCSKVCHVAFGCFYQIVEHVVAVSLKHYQFSLLVLFHQEIFPTFEEFALIAGQEQSLDADSHLNFEILFVFFDCVPTGKQVTLLKNGFVFHLFS